MSDITQITWKDGMAFDVSLEGHGFHIDASEEFGGRGYGPKPKSLLLSALGGCTGMDVVSMLKKMRVPYESISIEVSGDLTDEHPKVYHQIHIIYRFTGDALDEAKINRAIDLSQTRYCGVTKMLEGTAKITHEVHFNG